MGHIKTTEEGEKKNFTIAVSANWSGTQLFPQPTSLLRREKKNIFSSHGVSLSNITSQTTLLLARLPRSHVGAAQETRRSRQTVGLVPPSVSVVVKPACGAKKIKRLAQHSLFIDTHPPKQRHMYSHPLLSPPRPSPSPRSRAILFDQKHFLCICCLPSDDSQTSSAVWWPVDGSRSRAYLEKKREALDFLVSAELRSVVYVAFMSAKPNRRPGRCLR